MSLEWRDKDARFGLLLFICFFFLVCLSSFSAICSLMAAVTILTSLVYVNPHLTITSKWHKWVGVSETFSLQRRFMLLSLVSGDASPHKPQIHPIILMFSENLNPDWLTDFLCLGVENVLGQSSSAALLCWGSRLWRYGNIKSKLSVPSCPTVCAILGGS